MADHSAPSPGGSVALSVAAYSTLVAVTAIWPVLRASSRALLASPETSATMSRTASAKASVGSEALPETSTATAAQDSSAPAFALMEQLPAAPSLPTTSSPARSST